VAAACIWLSLLINGHEQVLVDRLIPVLLVGLSFAIFLNFKTFWHFRREHHDTDRAFLVADCEFSSIFQNVLDGILIVDDGGICLDANPAAGALLRCAPNELIGQNICRFLANSNLFAAKWSCFLKQKKKRGRAELIASDGSKLVAEYTAAANYLPGRHVFIICDATERTKAELKIIEQFDMVEKAQAEAEALRKSTLAISYNLAMDSVLDSLLECISELVPFDRAAVMFLEVGSELMVAREAPQSTRELIGLTLPLSECALLSRIVSEQQPVFRSDVSSECAWQDSGPFEGVRSWMGVPLVAGSRVLGVLSLGSTTTSAFTEEHFRLAKSLAVPAAVAIQSARTQERAEIYAAELEIRLRSLSNTQEPWSPPPPKSSEPN
jgi:PAS domain S-box-containing protein